MLAGFETELPPGGVSDKSRPMLYDVIERQRLECAILERIDAIVAECPGELRGYLSVPIGRLGARPDSELIAVITTSAGWFVSAGGFFEQGDDGWLAKLDMAQLRSCFRFLISRADLARGLSVSASFARARAFKLECDGMQW